MPLPVLFTRLLIVWIFLLISSTAVYPQAKNKKPVIIAYVGGFRGIVDTDKIHPGKITHINYAFVDVKNNQAWLHNLATDSINFRKLNLLKKTNPDLKILISLGGWSWSENFSDAVLSDTSRSTFAKTSVDIVRKYNLDGVDIDWEYPGMRGEDNVFRPEDKQNYTLMFQAIRRELDNLQKETGKTYQLTTAVGGFTQFIEKTEMDKAQQYLDYVNIMSYDFFTVGDTAGHHTNLFPSRQYDTERSTHRAVTEFIAAGVPAEKIVIGIAFYGRSWNMVNADNNGLNRKVLKVGRGAGYSQIKDSLVDQRGYIRYWDKKAKAPYLFNAQENVFVSYDDEESVKQKCLYVKKNKLGGVMFWEYFRDPKEYLLDAINKTL